MVRPVSESYVFAGGLLERVDFRRRDAEWIAARLADPASRLLPVWRLAVPVREGAAPELTWIGCDRRPEQGPDPILLGVRDDRAHFALDVSAIADPVAELGLAGTTYPDLRAVASRLVAGDAAIAAQARHLVDWHARHRFCSVCGQPSKVGDAGHVRRCSASECAAEHFPRTDPVVIMLVTRGDCCLLGRQPKWPHPFFSALAGFVEPGETLEEAVRREVFEEAGVRVAEVRYHSSQPWPFPASLMMGCMAEASTEEIRVDAHELEDARWFTRDDARAALAGKNRDLALPPPLAIAHQLVRAWVG
ncbi:MAG: NAD(+) diphosphatase [Deltaproteobacteria bacterium]|nr:NAD(+) diphosphatase [Deltaproteobacteria bacterium]